MPVAFLAGRFCLSGGGMEMSDQERKRTVYCFVTIGALTERGRRVFTESLLSAIVG
jgi:hypothetical protein